MYFIRQLVLFPFLVSFYSEEIYSFYSEDNHLIIVLNFDLKSSSSGFHVVRLENKMASLLEHQKIVLQASAILHIHSDAS